MRGNSISIKGNITRDGELRSTSTGKIVIEWGIAWNSSRPNLQTGQYEDVPHYFDCFAWLTEAQCRAVQDQIVKGAGCAIIDGSLDYSSWEDQAGKHSRVRIKVNDPISGMLLTAPKSRGASAQAYTQERMAATDQNQAVPQRQNEATYQPKTQYQPTTQPTTFAAPQNATAIYDSDIPF